MSEKRTSDKQCSANRRNAQRSSGPVTQAGKAISRYNATRHGVLSSRVLLPGEEGAQLEDLRRAMLASWAPADITEALLVERMVVNTWRLRRVLNLERYLLEGEIGELMLHIERSAEEKLGHKYIENQEVHAVLSRYEGALERSLYRAMRELRRIRADRNPEEKEVGPHVAE